MREVWSGLVPRPVQMLMLVVLELAEDRQGGSLVYPVDDRGAVRCDGLGEAKEELVVTPAKIARREV
jgi:hypothetical protein